MADLAPLVQQATTKKQVSDLSSLVQGAAAVAFAGELVTKATEVLSVGLPYLHGTGDRWAGGTVGLMGTDDGDEDGGSDKTVSCRRSVVRQSAARGMNNMLLTECDLLFVSAD